MICNIMKEKRVPNLDDPFSAVCIQVGTLLCIGSKSETHVICLRHSEIAKRLKKALAALKPCRSGKRRIYQKNQL
jgi:hypothetical protein